MARLLGRVGLLAFLAFGILAVLRPEYMPHVPVPYDKLLHIGVFALATLCGLASFRDRRAGLCAAGVIFIAGIGIEVFQAMLPGRSADLMDAGANAVGALLVLAGSAVLRRQPESAPDARIDRQIIAAYQRELAMGRPQAACLGAAAEACRLARPHLADHDIRLYVVRLVEQSGAHHAPRRAG